MTPARTLAIAAAAAALTLGAAVLLVVADQAWARWDRRHGRVRRVA